MKRLFLLLFISFLTLTNSEGQHYENEVNCSTDTLVTEFFTIDSLKNIIQDSIITVRAFKCETRSPISIVFGSGYTRVSYLGDTKAWINNHGLINMNLSVGFKKITLGVKVNTFTYRTLKDLEFSTQTILQGTKVNPNIVDWYLGYSIDTKKNISLEPFIGQNKSSFYFVDHEELNIASEIPCSKGIIIGTVINKYFQTGDHSYGSLFFSFGYGFTDFTNSHPDLGKGYFDISLGIRYKGYLKKGFLEFID